MMIWISLVALLAATPATAQDPPEDIDVFMEKVLKQRAVNWENFYNYFCKERAELSIEGSLPGVPIHGFRKEFLWFVRDGYVVRSPLSVDGVRVSPKDRERAEKKWIDRLKKRERERGPDRETFFGLKFEPGNYFYAGRKEFEGREVVVVEYYPESGPWNDDDEDDDSEDDEIEAQISKVLLVTMLIDPKEHQIVKMTLDNVGFDFLPAKWLFQLDTIEASLTMHRPIENIWLARDIRAYGRITLAGGDLAIRYKSIFYDYVKSETRATVRFPPRGSTEKAEEEKPPE